MSRDPILDPDQRVSECFSTSEFCFTLDTGMIKFGLWQFNQTWCQQLISIHLQTVQNVILKLSTFLALLEDPFLLTSAIDVTGVDLILRVKKLITGKIHGSLQRISLLEDAKDNHPNGDGKTNKKIAVLSKHAGK